MKNPSLHLSLILISLLGACLPLPSQTQQPEIQQAIALTQAARYPEAEAAWKKLAEAQPNNPAIHAALAHVLAQQNLLDQAAIEYRKSLTLDPHQPDVSLNLGLAEFKQGKFAAAIDPLLAARQDSRTNVLLGMSFYGSRAYGKAVPYLQTSVAADPTNAKLHTVLAESCLWSAQYDCAMNQYRSILTADPNSVQSHMLLAEALDALNRSPEAIQELEEAARIAPEEPNVHFELGYLYFVAHDYDHAAPQFEFELKNNPDHAQAAAYLGDIKLRSNNQPEAERLLTRALHLQNDMRMAWFDLGKVLSDQNKNQEALAAFQKAESLDPADPDAHYRLARLYTTLGQKEKAQQEYTKTRELHTKAADTLIQKVSGGEHPSNR